MLIFVLTSDSKAKMPFLDVSISPTVVFGRLDVVVPVFSFLILPIPAISCSREALRAIFV